MTKTLKRFDRGADGHDRQADDEFGDAETLGQGCGAVGQEVGPDENRRQANEKQKNIHKSKIKLAAISAMPATTP